MSGVMSEGKEAHIQQSGERIGTPPPHLGAEGLSIHLSICLIYISQLELVYRVLHMT